MVRFRAILDPAKKTHRSVNRQIVLEIDRIQVFHSNPPEYGSRMGIRDSILPEVEWIGRNSKREK